MFLDKVQFADKSVQILKLEQKMKVTHSCTYVHRASLQVVAIIIAGKLTLEHLSTELCKSCNDC